VAVALDRSSIEKKDFPIGRRGYEPEAVDAHLADVAEEVDTLRRSSRRRTESLASAASEQVRAIVEAAESSAADIQRQAEEEAREIRSDAARDAERTRADAASQARGHVDGAAEATQTMLGRLEAMDSELGALVESLRTGANRLVADLSLLQDNMGTLREAAGEHSGPGPARAGSALSGLGADETELEPPATDVDDELPEPLGGPALRAAAAATQPAEPAGSRDGEDDEAAEGARLIALNMALNGTPREETERYLAENFDLRDPVGLLDEVYSRVG